MNKKIISLLAVFLVLAAAAFFKAKTKPVSYNLEQEMGVESLLPKDFLYSDVNRIEIYAASKPEQKVIINKNKDLNQWSLETHFQAPAKRKTVEEFLENLKALQGEMRSSSKEVLEDFSLGEKQALFLKVYRFEKDKEQISTLLVGKKDGHNACFIRKLDSDVVYRIGKDLRSQVGMWSDEPDKSPENNHWLDKTIWKFGKEEISKLSLQYPDKKLAFDRVLVKEEKPVVEPEKFLDKKEEKAPIQDNKPKKEEKKYEWILASGGPEKKFNVSELTKLTDLLSSWEAADIVDPSQKEQYGLLKPAFKIEVLLEGDKKKVFVAGQNDIEKEGYGYVEDNPNVVYKIENWAFLNSLFKKGSKFFTLPSLTIDKTQIKEIKLSYPQANIALSRLSVGEKDKEKVSWTLVSPTDKILVQSEAANEMAGKICNLKLEDYSDETSPEILGLQNPYYQITVLLKDDSTHTLKIGKNSPSMNGRYALIEETKAIGAVEKTDIDRLFPAFDKLFKLEPLNMQVDEFTLSAKEKSFSLKKQQGEWQILVGEAIHKADTQKVEESLKAFAPLKASKILFDRTMLQEQKPQASFLLAQGDAKETISVYSKENSFYPVVLSDQKEVYYLEEKIVDSLLQDWNSYSPSSHKPEKEVEKQEEKQ
ncbi:MAG: DUF4340 domain-containing protein [Candidatus Brocadiae bacterium]|nr:DUF4340 domain-containing protein [Candidatus Brocadiia bacterium]